MKKRAGRRSSHASLHRGRSYCDDAFSVRLEIEWASAVVSCSPPSPQSTRRLLGDLGQDIESSVFSLVEMTHTHGPINRMNLKGLLKSDASKRVIRPKIAYYAIQNLTSVFDHALERLVDPSTPMV